jgi:septal ring factor EnvC (AmiA/AmiB activator)
MTLTRGQLAALFMALPFLALLLAWIVSRLSQWEATMSDDIVASLRKGDCSLKDTLLPAAHEIERLRSDIAKLEKSHGQLQAMIDGLTAALDAEREQRHRDTFAFGKTLSEMHRRVAKLRDALLGLNTALDAFWNDKTRPAIPNIATVTAIEDWQRRGFDALSETGADHV